HVGQAAEIVAAPADEIALGVVVDQLEAGLDPLDLGPALVQVFQVAVDHARHHYFLALEHTLDRRGQLLNVAGVAAQEERFAVYVVPLGVVAVALVPPGADAGLTGVAV